MVPVPGFLAMLDGEGQELYRKLCKERRPTEAARPLYALYAFYCTKLCGILGEDPAQAAGEEAKAFLDACIGLAMQLGIPDEISEWD